ncbi:MAG: FMN-binding protein [Proteobacteria bacterium]|nr:FMN-binding protein [Pseudomonadota bacterium]MBU1740107.1 FMN-binding protein [Pseudomonadota bacterium]
MVRRLLLIPLGLLLSACMTAHLAAPPVRWGPLPFGQVLDGVYLAQARRGPVAAWVRVEIRRRQIARVTVIKLRCAVCRGAEVTIPRRIVDHQSTRVDAVTGATVSSLAIMEAVQNAVDQAHRAWLNKRHPGPTPRPKRKAPARPPA